MQNGKFKVLTGLNEDLLAHRKLGEVNEIAPKLRELFEDVYEIDNPGHIEGGDILVTGREILVGRSARTDANGVSQLLEIVTGLGYVMREVFTPPEIFPLKGHIIEP